MAIHFDPWAASSQEINPEQALEILRGANVSWFWEEESEKEYELRCVCWDENREVAEILHRRIGSAIDTFFGQYSEHIDRYPVGTLDPAKDWPLEAQQAHAGEYSLSGYQDIVDLAHLGVDYPEAADFLKLMRTPSRSDAVRFLNSINLSWSLPVPPHGESRSCSIDLSHVSPNEVDSYLDRITLSLNSLLGRTIPILCTKNTMAPDDQYYTFRCPDYEGILRKAGVRM